MATKKYLAYKEDLDAHVNNTAKHLPDGALPIADGGTGADTLEGVQANLGIDALLARPVNNNLLINSNFANPVNQRGQDSYSTDENAVVYTIDRWCINAFTLSTVTVNVENNHVNMIANGEYGGALIQKVEFPENYAGKTLTLSVKYRVNSQDIKTAIIIAANDSPSGTVLIDDGEWHIATKTLIMPDTLTKLEARVWSQKSCDLDVEWAKLEVGEVATPYVPRLYEEELQLCQYYYQKFHVNKAPYLITPDGIYGIFHIPNKMRLAAPTVDLSDLTIRHFKNSVSETIDLSSWNNPVIAINTPINKAYLTVSKTSHGYTKNDQVAFDFLMILDAEM